MTKITDEVLLEQLNAAIAKAEAAAASANAAAANASSAQSSTGAAGGTASARTQSNSETDTDRAVSTGQTYENVDSDINFNETLQVGMNRTNQAFQSFDLEGFNRNRLHFDELVAQRQKHLANLDHMTLQALANNQNQSNVANGLLIDRAWNVNETDAYAVLLAKVTSDVAKALDAK